MMTEDEAKAKWCPMVRTRPIEKDGYAHAVGVNRDEGALGEHVESNCIGSGCMMWKWGWDSDVERSKTHGYCGLAG